jgi:hypothetical protein
VAGAAWQRSLRQQASGYVEFDGAMTIRACLLGDDAAPLHEARRLLFQPLPPKAFAQARGEAAANLAQAGMSSAFQSMWPQAQDRTGRALRLIQSSIDRLRFEADGGQERLDAIDALTPEDVAAAARKFLVEEREVRQRPGS